VGGESVLDYVYGPPIQRKQQEVAMNAATNAADAARQELGATFAG
jgi:hypothetical protein